MELVRRSDPPGLVEIFHGAWLASDVDSRAASCLRGGNASRTSTKQETTHPPNRPRSTAVFIILPTDVCLHCVARKYFADDRKRHLQQCLHHSVGLPAEAPRAVDRLHHLAPEVAAQDEVAHLVTLGDVELVEGAAHPLRIQKQKGYYKDCKLAA